MVVQDDTVKEFVAESFENLAALDGLLLDLEQEADSTALNQVFRILHTVKGTCAFFGFSTLQALSHAGEFLLEKLRAGELAVSSEIVTALLELGDALREILSRIDTTGSEGSETYSSLVLKLNALQETDAGADTTERGNAPPASTVSEEEELETLFRQAQKEYETVQGLEPDSGLSNASDSAASEEEDLETLFSRAQLEYLASQESLKEQELSEASSEPALTSAEQSSGTPAVLGSPTIEKRLEAADSTLRVNVGRLDRLMNLVGELVLTRNQILQLTKIQGNHDLHSRCQRLNRVTSELQEEVMRTRMQPIATIWRSIPRLVRSSAQACGKDVELKLSGGETELDKTVLEAIKDPLTHIIRNAIDHGLESEAERIAAGKSAKGVLTLNAYHESGQVVIEIVDDGSGLKLDKIRQKAVAQGLLTQEQAGSMSAYELNRLIFHPGFSTAESVTAISGRGVGMDVVRSNIEAIGGSTDVLSREGHGTTFIIRIPLTLAVIPVLTVTVEGLRFAVPQANLTEVLQLKREINGGLEEIRGSLFYRLRNRLLPIVNLRNELNIDTGESQSDEASEVTIVVVEANQRRFGLVVDTVEETEEIVIKPFGRLLKPLSVYAGSTVMGDGVIALILDINGIAARLNLDAHDNSEELPAVEEPAGALSRLLIVEVNQDLQVAVMLDQVERLERFTLPQLERTSDMLAVQYNGKILPLFDLDALLCGSPVSYLEPINVLVHRTEGSYVGFVVRSVVDVLEESLEIETRYCGRGLRGSAIIGNSITDIIDLPTVLEKVIH